MAGLLATSRGGLSQARAEGLLALFCAFAAGFAWSWVRVLTLHGCALGVPALLACFCRVQSAITCGFASCLPNEQMSLSLCTLVFGASVPG